MNDFYDAVGFSNIKNRKQLDDILKVIIDEYDVKFNRNTGDDVIKQERIKYFGDNIGIRVCGELYDNGEFRGEYAYPFIKGSVLSMNRDVEVETRKDTDARVGISEDSRFGATLIYQFQEAYDETLKRVVDKNSFSNAKVYLTGLSDAGMIILPIANKGEVENNILKNKRRNELREEAIEGDEEALKTLALADYDAINMVGRRIQNEDVLSIVSTTFLPFGVESDHYMMIGEIEEFEYINNTLTEEEICIMKVICNNMQMTIGVNRNDLIGEPQVGRRFKGLIWLQGAVLL
ncbi:MAG: DUF3881 family protein [Lachnospiraceae bacterium]|nr:DUF3881 family protein [Lachnospiraceae bacterium]